MIQIVYASSATVPFTDAQLDQLLEISRRNNRENNLTGMLVYHDGDFLQVLEGDEKDVQETYQRIAKDSRHARIMQLDESEIESRSFGDWSMGFRRVQKDDIPEGFVDFFSRSFDEESVAERGSEAMQFLLSFRDISR